MVGYHVTLADFAVWGALRSCEIFVKQVKVRLILFQLLLSLLSSLESVTSALAALENAKDGAKDRSDRGNLFQLKYSGNMEIPLPDAHEGHVVTRFPPEPSGYLHIGHAKAALLNDYFARSYKGKLILRFDDTNPSKEKMEFENSIKEDLKLLGIKPDVTTHTSDNFDKIYDYAVALIKQGGAYVDNTDVDTMRDERFNGIESKNRNLSIEENLRIFDKEMKKGTELGMTYCLRAKIDMQDPNKCMRDPVLYRCNSTPHHVHGTKWKMYPTYDFACPIVDALEGVTHALRTIEYRDRNAQFEWFLNALKLRKVHVWDYSRLNFVYTLLSKRKLTWFVEEKLVTGWDDPRFPTVRGVLRRGMTVDALRTYIISQGASQREINLEWDKIWAINKKVIDPISPRHTALIKENLVKVKVLDEDLQPHVKAVPKHKKNPDVGTKTTTYSRDCYLEQADAATLEIGEEVTLMDWGNVFVKNIVKSGELVKSVEISLHLEGDFKKTKKKLTWLSEGSKPESKLVDVVLFDFDYLITKKKLEEDDDIKDCLSPKTEFKYPAVGDANLRLLKKNDIIQFERKGYYICDKPATKGDDCVYLNFIPDGRAESIAPKSLQAAQPAAATSEKRVKAASAKPAQKSSDVKEMYSVDSIYNFAEPALTKVGQMYEVESIYPKQEAKAQVADKKPKEKKQKAKPAPPAAPVEASIISKLDMVVGKILEVRLHPDADSLYVEKIDVGEDSPREVVSGLVKFMKPEDMLNKTILVLKNLKPVAMRGIKSYAMVLCASNQDHTKVEFLVPPKGSLPGDKVYFEGHEGVPEAELKPKKKVWETVQADFTTGEDLVATWKGVPFRTAKGVVKAGSIAHAIVK
ncbi:hypothetical protein HDV02_000214 [Globomyces sp. JEL0801]|nr:hypothetical protein HDV02_000214 [Globomyces sp. JEL0801]